jgi:hypothetical protein
MTSRVFTRRPDIEQYFISRKRIEFWGVHGTNLRKH